MNLQYPIDEGYMAFKHIEIIKCKEHKFIIIGWNSSESEYNAIVIPKLRAHQELRPLSQLLREFGPFKTMQDIKKDIEDKLGGFHEKESIFAHGILGFHCFLQGYYLTYIKQTEAIAKIGRHKVYEIKSTQMLQLFESRSDSTLKAEKEYRKIREKYQIENYYYSYTYDLTNTLARNMVVNSLALFSVQIDKKQEYISIYSNQCEFLGISEMFQYNHKLVEEFYRALTCKKWVISIIHGFAKHINFKFKGTIFNLIVIGRRSRHQAGTRYMKRGINGEGFAANFVEVEQIVINYTSSQDTRPVCSSFVQVRGSVPTYWMQRSGFTNPKPAIELRSSCDYMCVGTRKHFHDMVGRYGRILFCVNLMKQKEKTPRESELSKDYQNAITLINKNDLREENAIHYSEIDMKFELKRDKKAFIQQVKTFAYFSILRTGMFVCVNPSTSSRQQLLEFQNGVIRANCVDCLDRTNSFQQLVGGTVLAIQLNRLIGEDSRPDQLQLDENIMQVYSKLYEQMGDVISLQYGSSLAHKQKIQKSTQSRFQLLTSLKRHLNNTFNDEFRQMQIDIFLGYSPDKDSLPLWQIDPVIEHYPNEYVNLFEKMKKYEWFDKAYLHFLNYYHLRDFEKIARKDLHEMNLPKMEKIMKEQLIHKFRGEIVSSLINEKEEAAGCCWLVEPRVHIKQQIWKEINPRSATIRTLDEELRLAYNKMDFLKTEDLLSSHMPPIKITKPPKQTRKPTKTKQFNLDEDLSFMRDIEKYAAQQILDEEQLKMLEKSWQGESIPDDEIEKNVNDLYSLVNEDLMSDHFMIQNTITEVDVLNEMRRIQSNLASNNFIGNGEEVDAQVIYRRDQQPEVRTQKNTEPRRKEMVRENKVKMLEQIMAKSFSLGGVSHVTEV